MDDKTIVIGTRGSALALWQAKRVGSAIESTNPGVSCVYKTIKTTGDKNLTDPLSQIGDKGLFTKELEAALVLESIDICVHSMKDVPSVLAPGCEISAVLERADARDAVVLNPELHAGSLEDLPLGTHVATGSRRRVALLGALYPGLVCVPIRGNVDTRLRKVDEGSFGAAVFASAGLERLGHDDRIAFRLDPSVFVPACGQGAIGVEARQGDDRVTEMLGKIDHAPTRLCVDAERVVLAALEGGCQVPMGIHASITGDEFVLEAFVSSVDGIDLVRSRARTARDGDTLKAANEVVDDLLAQGAQAIRDAVLEEGTGGGR